MTPVISVVVPTYRRPRLLDRCLSALLAQDLKGGEYEIIVVDDGPEDSATRELVAQHQARLAEVAYPGYKNGKNGCGSRNGARQKAPMELSEYGSAPVAVQVAQRVLTPTVTYLPAWNTQGPAAARNLGWRAAKSEIIAFTDDDTLPDPSWLSKGLEAFRNSDLSGASGQVVVPVPEHPTDHELNTTGLERSLFVTANCFYRRSALEAVGGFDEQFHAAWREDSDLYFTMLERGLLMMKAPEAVVVHPVRPEPWGTSLKQQKKSVYNALLYKKHPELYRQQIQAAPPWNYYLTALAILAAAVGALAGSEALLGLGAGAWLWFTGSFACRRLKHTTRAPGHVVEMIVTSALIPLLSIYWRIRGAIRYRVWFL